VFFCRFGVDCVLDTDGLSVHDKHRGKGLAKMLLKGRLEMMRGLHIPLTKTMFVAEKAQSAAKNAGFEIVKELPYQKLVDEDGNVIYSNLDHTAQLCVLRA
jgi:GNAT superfamily N-acetyltransferase